MTTNDGKYLEEAVEKIFKEKMTQGDPSFRYRRLPDSKAARGLIQAQPADFFLSDFGFTVHLECKSCGSKTYRLPKFDQHAEMRAWSKAGVKGIVVIHFHIPNVFCFADVDELKIGKASFDFKTTPKYVTLEELFEASDLWL